MGRTGQNHELAALMDEAGWSHAMLARHVVAAGATTHGLRLAYDYRAVSRWLRGAVPDPPTPNLIAAVLSRALGRSITTHQLGFHAGDLISRSLVLPTTPLGSVTTTIELWRTAMDRRAFLANSAFLTGMAVETAVDWRFAPPPAAGGVAHDGARQVTGNDLEQVRAAYTEFRTLDSTHGGGYALGWLHQYLVDDLAPLLHGRYTDTTGTELFRAAAALTNMAGWMAMDNAQHGLGQRMYTQAAGLALHAGDTAFGAHVIGNMATHALYIGHTRTAVRLTRTARDGAGHNAPATLIARNALTEARAHALLGDAHETRRALHIAEQAMNRSDPHNDPEWLGVWTPAHHAGGVMHALRDLGASKEAARYAPEAMDLPAQNTRTRALHGILHATVLAGHGDLDGAVATAQPVLHTAPALRSKRLNQRLNEFDARLAPHRGTAVVANYGEEARQVRKQRDR